ncbi:MAG TPA: beta-L-arabinofuranosidase domain-containing protein [Thermomicrobiales bacterium]|nr:beta-L-arabinofuranosidase domain-containing protein [Thermomicrobiales bacterium]
MATAVERGAGPVDTARSPHARWRTLPAGAASLTGGLWGDRQAVNGGASLAHGYRQLEEAGNFHDFRLAAGRARGEYRGPRYMDSDVYKWLEAAGWELGRRPDADLQRMVDGAIATIAAAQTPEGYLHTYTQVVAPDQRWADLAHAHELYCAGHLIQAAIAQRRATGDDRLLEVARRCADDIAAVFGPGIRQRLGTPGHPEIELALVELYRETRERRYLDLAAFFLDQHGRGLLREQPAEAAYFADRQPVREAAALEGHAVRALYLVAGVTDLYLETGERALLDATLRQWDDLVAHKLYVTGGVGARHEGEAFGAAFELPHERAYCETCAAVASIFWNWRLLLATGEGRFADLLERTLYNGFLSGVALDGRRFAYVNPLASDGPDWRAPWFTTACCPPNVMRLLATFGHYLATTSAGGVQLHQYTPARVEAELAPDRPVHLWVETEYPWRGPVRVTIAESHRRPWQLALRVPGWCAGDPGLALRLNGRPATLWTRDGYALIDKVWQRGDVVELDLPLTPRAVAAHPLIEAARGCVALERGPLVYCLEQHDQEQDVDVRTAQLDAVAPLAADRRDDLLGGVTVLRAGGYAPDPAPWQGRLYRPLAAADAARRPARLTAIPYYARGNRGPAPLRVWAPRA